MVDQDVHPELQKQLADMHRVHASILAYTPRAPHPPILDSSLDSDPSHSRSDSIPGLRPLLESVSRDIDVIEQFLADPHVAGLPPLSTNAPYLVAVWKEVLFAHPPIVAISKSFQEGKGRPKPSGNGHLPKSAVVKVDVVADNGRSWIRVNTTKNSRLLAELREIDSYMTDSDSDSDSPSTLFGRSSLAQTTFNNSLLRAGRALLAAAQANIVSTSHGPHPPTVTIRFTRLDPNADDDPRIALTLDMLRDLGIVVELGDRGDEIFSEQSAAQSEASDRPTLPTLHVNLDLSVLIALVSDLTHAPLPSTSSEAAARFVPSSAYIDWKRARTQAKRAAEANGADGEDNDIEADLDVGKHSRALAEQLQQEMQKGLLQEMRDQLKNATCLSTSSPSSDLSGVEFWTTPDARDRCLRIMSKIGGPNERRRASALLSTDSTPLQDCQREYWRHSRYPENFIPLLPIRIFPSSLPSETCTTHAHFSAALEMTCRTLLSLDSAPALAPSIPPISAETSTRTDRQASDIGQGEIGRAAVTRTNPKLTAHTVQSLLWGAVTSRTTLTANRGSVKTVLREMRARGAGAAESGEKMGDAEVVDGKPNAKEAAAIWVVDPRSLAEGMRSDFVA